MLTQEKLAYYEYDQDKGVGVQLTVINDVCWNQTDRKLHQHVAGFFSLSLCLSLSLSVSLSLSICLSQYRRWISSLSLLSLSLSLSSEEEKSPGNRGSPEGKVCGEGSP